MRMSTGVRNSWLAEYIANSMGFAVMVGGVSGKW
jgi:hypothetical protein